MNRGGLDICWRAQFTQACANEPPGVFCDVVDKEIFFFILVATAAIERVGQEFIRAIDNIVWANSKRSRMSSSERKHLHIRDRVEGSSMRIQLVRNHNTIAPLPHLPDTDTVKAGELCKGLHPDRP